MAELRIPREHERLQLEEIYQCVKEECAYVEALLSINYSMMGETITPKIRCTKGNLFLTPESKTCGNYSKVHR
jgi:branched-subunit amino acid aminotransferase/4-amino-4-deoxychorismate lyase